MSHEIETNGSEAAFVSAREDAWHRLGTVLPDTFDAATALSTAHLAGWNVRKVPVVAPIQLGDGGGVINLSVPDQFAVVRDSPWTEGQVDVLGSVGKFYTPIQNEDHAGFLDALVDESGAHFETAGSLKDGKQVFVTMKLPETIQFGGKDRVDLYLAALNSHDGTSSFRLLITPIRVVCANTQAAALANNERMIKIRHTAKATQQVQQAREALDLTFAYMAEFQAEAERMMEREYTEAQFQRLLDRLVGKVDPEKPEGYRRPLETARESLTWSFTDSDTNEGIRGTRWAAYQAVTEYTDHLREMKGDDVADRRALAVLNGQSDDLKLNAWKSLVRA